MKDAKNRTFIELPGGRIKIMRNKRGGPRAEKGYYLDEFDGKYPLPEKTHIITVGVTEEPNLLGFENIPSARLSAASYNGNGHVVVRTEEGQKYELPIRQQAA